MLLIVEALGDAAQVEDAHGRAVAHGDAVAVLGEGHGGYGERECAGGRGPGGGGGDGVEGGDLVEIVDVPQGNVPRGSACEENHAIRMESAMVDGNKRRG